jgi:flagellar motility protein MotE (MotC chaperone)
MSRVLKAKRKARILPVLTALFATGAALQLMTGLGAALAQYPAQPADPAMSAPSPVQIAAQQTATPTETAQVLLDLRARESALQQRESQLAERETLISAAQTRLEEQMQALASVESELSATMALADRAAEEDINRLVTVFEAMKAEEAAAVFAEMAPEFAAGFLGRLNPEAAAAILAGLEPRLAYTLSALLAGRNALVPRE